MGLYSKEELKITHTKLLMLHKKVYLIYLHEGSVLIVTNAGGPAPTRVEARTSNS